MPRSNSCVFQVALDRTAKHAGVTDTLTVNRRSKTRTRPIVRDQRSRRFGGTSNSADLVTVLQNLRGRDFAPHAYTRLKCATLSAASIWLTYVKVVSQSMP